MKTIDISTFSAPLVHCAVTVRNDGRVRMACQRVTPAMRPAPRDWRYVMYQPEAVTCWECRRRMPTTTPTPAAGC